MWERHRLTLLELLVTGETRRRQSNVPAWEELSALGWGRLTGRRGVLALDPAHEVDVRSLLDRAWPGWPPEAEALRCEGLPPTERGWRELERRRQAERARDLGLPARLNRRTAASLVTGRSKARVEVEGVELTVDGLIRLRPNRGLRVGGLAVVPTPTSVGEVALTERALRGGARLEGAMPRALLTVENLGPYVDLALPEGWAAAHVPGWNTRPLALLLERIPSVPLVHFGDLDPNGVRIARHLQALRPGLAWLVPAFTPDYLPRTLECSWPDDLVGPADPPVVQDLARRGLWLEQEALVLDPRLPEAMEAALRGV